MRLLNLTNYLYFVIYLLISITPLKAEEDSVDIWKKKTSENNQNVPLDINQKESTKITIDSKKKENLNSKINITKQIDSGEKNIKLFGLFDPEKNNFNLNMWTRSNGKDVKDTFMRINKINLSSSAEDIFINTIMTYSYSPDINLSEEEFLNLKVDWLISNNKDELLIEVLKKNDNFERKKTIIQYLVDKSISKANLVEGCKQGEFISKEIKDSYLEKFKIYCLIFSNKKNEAQLLFDLLKEQGLSEKFYNNKINYLLGINSKPDNVIKDNNLLNFYLSSITVKEFNYTPDENTNKYIWQYLSSANLIKVENIGDKTKITNLELAANNNTLNKAQIFEIYKKIPFDVGSLINAEQIYQSLDGIDSRALIYQKILLSDNVENKIKLLFLLKDLFKNDNLLNIYSKILSDNLEALDENSIPEAFKEIVKINIISDNEFKSGKIKYDDKILHRSRILRYYTESDTPVQKSQKDLTSVYKKIKKNKKYFFSAKDLTLLEALEQDGFNIPKGFNFKEISKQYQIPKGLYDLMKNREIGLLALKFVEIIGEDEISNLDAETIYFITHILNKANLKKFRNNIINIALPLRV